jgi:hypothetical protein
MTMGRALARRAGQMVGRAALNFSGAQDRVLVQHEAQEYFSTD